MGLLSRAGFSIYFALYGKRKYPPLTQPQWWALSAGANLAMMNGSPVDVLHVGYSTKQVKILLENWWDIHTKDQLVKILLWLKEEGHREALKEILIQISPLSIPQWQDFLAQIPAHQQIVYNFVRSHKDRFIHHNLLAWDLCRLINLARFGYTVGYLTDDEAWSWIMPAAHELQNHYQSFEQLSDSYLLGWRFWQEGAPLSDEDPLYRTAVWLKTAPSSPWKKLDWSTPLSS